MNWLKMPQLAALLSRPVLGAWDSAHEAAGRVQSFTTCSVWICSRILSFSFQNYVVQPWVSLNSSSPDCSWLNSNISSFRRDLAAWQWAFPGSVFHGPLLVQWYTFCPGRIYGEINWDWCARINMENLWGMWIFDTWMHCKPAKNKQHFVIIHTTHL